MSEFNPNWTLAVEVEEILRTTISLAEVLEAQQQQISGMVHIFEKLFENPSLFQEKHDVIERMVQGVKTHQTPGNKGNRPGLRVVGK